MDPQVKALCRPVVFFNTKKSSLQRNLRCKKIIQMKINDCSRQNKMIILTTQMGDFVKHRFSLRNITHNYLRSHCSVCWLQSLPSWLCLTPPNCQVCQKWAKRWSTEVLDGDCHNKPYCLSNIWQQHHKHG